MTFDPYYKWLGIPSKDQPPNHYRLLGIELFETDRDVIASAATQRMAHLRTCQLGPHSDLSQKLLNEVAAAKLCLLIAEEKEAYDAQLRARMQEVPHQEEKRNLDFGEIQREPTEDQPPPSVPPLPPARAPWFPKLQFWYYAVGIGVAGSLLVGIWAFLTMGGNPEQQVAVADPEQPAVPQRGDVAVASLPESPPWDPRSPPPKPDPVTTPSESPSPKVSLEPPSSTATSTKSFQPKSDQVAPAIYRVIVDPPSATLREDSHRAVMTGSGREREVRIERPEEDSKDMLLVASCDGYVAQAKFLKVARGLRDEVSFSLEKALPSETASPPLSGEAPPTHKTKKAAKNQEPKAAGGGGTGLRKAILGKWSSIGKVVELRRNGTVSYVRPSRTLVGTWRLDGQRIHVSLRSTESKTPTQNIWYDVIAVEADKLTLRRMGKDQENWKRLR